MNILISGANSEIGKKLSNFLIAKNDKSLKLILTSRTHNQQLEKLQTESVRYLYGMDLLLENNNKRIADVCNEFFNGPFNFVHSVGDFWDHVPFTEVPTERARRIMDSHYTTLYGLLQSLIPIMIQKGGGKILTFSCNSVKFNYPYMIPFTSAKAAVEALTKCIAHEYVKNNINANTIALSSVQTEAVKKSKPFGDFEHYISMDSLSELILEILSANSLINGSIINCFTYSESFYNEGYFQRIRGK